MNSQVVEISISQEERVSGTLSQENLKKAVAAVLEDGIVVLLDVVSQDSISALKEKSLADTEALLNRKDVPFNWSRGNIQQNPPPFPPFLFRDVLVNDFVISVSKGVLGAGIQCDFYSGNTALPSETRQPVHADIGQLWPNLKVVPPPHMLVVNVPLVDMGPENGSTEVWLGTHKDTHVAMQDGDIELPDHKLEAQKAIAPPIQPVVKAGSVVIRDIRMWHAGMPNHTPNPRPMIAMIHTIGWWPTGSIRFAKGSEEFLSHPDLRWKAEYTDEVLDHIAEVSGYKAELAVEP